MGKTSCYFFLAPKNDIALNDWRRAIPRKDQTFSEKDYLCEKHFMPQDIIRFESVVVNDISLLSTTCHENLF
jgi:hypothetical protein